MCTKWFNDGDVHAYFSPYESPYDAYIAFMNALSDLQLRVQHAVAKKQQQRGALVEVPKTPSLWRRFIAWLKTFFRRYSFFKKFSF